MRFCKDCKYFLENESGEPRYRCTRDLVRQSLVTGEKWVTHKYLDCVIERNFDIGYCGPMARFFEPKDGGAQHEAL